MTADHNVDGAADAHRDGVHGASQLALPPRCTRFSGGEVGSNLRLRPFKSHKLPALVVIDLQSHSTAVLELQQGNLNNPR